MLGLDYLISPVEPDDFIRDYWSKKAIYIPGDEAKFDGLFSWDTVNDLLFSSRNFQGVRLIHDKNVLDHREFQRLNHWLQQGATLAINNVNTIDPLLSRFQSVLSFELNTQININSYMSYPTKQGFDIHADRHDVFIVHTEGEKDWKVFPPTKTYPLHKERNQDSGDPPDADPYIECTMTPGDILYIPRGHWHYAQSTTPSIHLTVGPASVSASEFMLWWASELMDGDEFYRRDFPLIRSGFRGGVQEDQSLLRHNNEFRQRLRAMLDDDGMMDEFLARYALLHNPLSDDFNLPEAWDEANSLSRDTFVMVRQDQKFQVYFDDDSQFANVVSRGRETRLEGIPRDLLAAILSCQGESGMKTVRQLMETSSDVYWDAISGWLMQLYHDGVVTLQ